MLNTVDLSNIIIIGAVIVTGFIILLGIIAVILSVLSAIIGGNDWGLF